MYVQVFLTTVNSLSQYIAQKYYEQEAIGAYDVNWFTLHRTRAIAKKCYGLRATSPSWVTSKRANQRWRKRRALTFFPRTLLPRLFSLAELSELSESLLVGCYGFHFCERWLHRHHNGSVNSKCTHYPKSICQVLTSPLALDIWTRADKIA